MPREPSNGVGFVEALHLVTGWLQYFNPSMPGWIAQAIAVSSLIAFALLSLRLLRVILVIGSRTIILVDGAIRGLARRVRRRLIGWRRSTAAKFEAKMRSLARGE
jgi:hypothetical protein